MYTPAVLSLLFSFGMAGRPKPSPVALQLPSQVLQTKPISRPVSGPGHAHSLLHDSMNGLASWYGEIFRGRKTANGETFDDTELTACHHTLPFGSRVRVTNLSNGRSVVVRINDRGTLEPGRIIDLSTAAAEKLHMLEAGVARVRLETVPPLTVADNSPAVASR